MIDLQMVGNNLVLSKKENLLKQLEKTKSIYLSFGMMSKAFPEVKPLSEYTVFRVFEESKKVLRTYTITTLNKEGELVLRLPDFNRTTIEDDFEIISFLPKQKCTKVSFRNVELLVYSQLSDLGKDFVADLGKDFVENEEILSQEINVEWFSEYKILGIKLVNLPKGKYRAKLNGLNTAEYNSQMCDLTDFSSKTEYKNVICNSALYKILQDGDIHTIVLGDTFTGKNRYEQVEVHEPINW